MGNDTSTIIPVEIFSDVERLALAGFLGGYSGRTRNAYALDLRQFASWCSDHGLRLFGVRRADIECFGRDLEATTRRALTSAVPATTTRVPGGGPGPATNSEPCWWRPGSAVLATTR